MLDASWHHPAIIEPFGQLSIVFSLLYSSMASRRSQFYNEDDFDDGYDSEEDWYGDEEEESDQPAQAPPKVRQLSGWTHAVGHWQMHAQV